MKGKKMGRYYNGDIEGKFWFGIQNSTDADFFGVEGEPRFYHYYFGTEDKKNVHKGMLECDRHLGKYRELIDEFFKNRESYNSQMLIEYLDEKAHPTKHTEEGVRYYLEWYARLQLGRQIYDCILEKGECDFEAEL